MLQKIPFEPSSPPKLVSGTTVNLGSLHPKLDGILILSFRRQIGYRYYSPKPRRLGKDTLVAMRMQVATILAFIRNFCFENLELYKITLGQKFRLTFRPFSLKLAFKITKVYLKHWIFLRNGTTFSFMKILKNGWFKKITTYDYGDW